jgi:hypothetical protein
MPSSDVDVKLTSQPFPRSVRYRTLRPAAVVILQRMHNYHVSVLFLIVTKFRERRSLAFIPSSFRGISLVPEMAHVTFALSNHF